MKKVIFILLILSITAVTGFSQEKTMYVAVKSTDIKSAAGNFAAKLGTLNLGDAVTLIRSSGTWAEIRTSKALTGWVAMSSLSSKRVTSSGVSSTAGEIALAGKGFSPETEIEYKKGGLDFAEVDQMERITVSMSDLEKFIKDGRLKEGK